MAQMFLSVVMDIAITDQVRPPVLFSWHSLTKFGMAAGVGEYSSRVGHDPFGSYRRYPDKDEPELPSARH